MQTSELETYTLEPSVALEKWKEYVKVEKETSAQHIKDLKKAYYALSKGKRVIDVFETVKRVGLNQDAEPALAIAPITAKTCEFKKTKPGSGHYGIRSGRGWRAKNHWELSLPVNTFPTWPSEEGRSYNLLREQIQSTVPIIPAQHMPKSTNHRYILYEVEHWTPAAPKDPILLYRLTSNLFAIEAKWSLSKLERAIIRGRL